MREEKLENRLRKEVDRGDCEDKNLTNFEVSRDFLVAVMLSAIFFVLPGCRCSGPTGSATATEAISSCNKNNSRHVHANNDHFLHFFRATG